MQIINKIDTFISENLKSNILSLTTNEINSIIKKYQDLDVNKVYDSKYLGLYKDLYSAYLIIFKNNSEGTYVISRLWFAVYDNKEYSVVGYDEYYNEDLNDNLEFGFESLNDAKNYMKKIKASKDLIKVKDWLKN